MENWSPTGLHRDLRATRLVVLVLLLATVAACGTRVSRDEIAAAAGYSTVSLDSHSISEIRKAASAARPGGAAASQDGATNALEASAVTTPPAPRQPSPVAPRADRGGLPTTFGETAKPGVARTPAKPGTRRAECSPGGAVPITVGQVGSFSGVAGPITSKARETLALWARHVNAQGGLRCHPVKVYAVDDGGDPARAATAVKSLVVERKVVAIVGSVVAFSIGGFLPALAANRVPAVGGELVAPEWNTSPWMFPQGAGIDDQLDGLLRAITAAGRKNVGLVYCVEVGACTYAADRIQKGSAERAGATLKMSAAVSLAQVDYTAQCLNAKNAGVDALILAIDGSAMTRVARSCDSVGFRPLLAAVSGTFSAQNTEDRNLRAFGMLSATGVAPWTATDSPGPRLFHDTIQRYTPSLKPDGMGAVGWTSGLLLQAAVEKLSASEAGGAITSELLLTALGKIRRETLDGFTGPISFAPGQAKARSTGCTFYLQLGPGGWSAPKGSRPDCRRSAS